MIYMELHAGVSSPFNGYRAFFCGWRWRRSSLTRVSKDKFRCLFGSVCVLHWHGENFIFAAMESLGNSHVYSFSYHLIISLFAFSNPVFGLLAARTSKLSLFSHFSLSSSSSDLPSVFFYKVKNNRIKKKIGSRNN